MKMIDKALRMVGLQRTKSVVAMRAYAAAQVNRLTADWLTETTTIMADLRAGLKPVRERARDLVKNNDYARRYVDLVRVNVVGPAGFKFQSNVTEWNTKQEKFVQDRLADSKIESAWHEWTTNPELCSVGGRYSFRDTCDRLIRYAARDGEFLVQLVRNSGTKYGLQLHVLPIELLDEKFDKDLGGGASINMGVEVNATGQVVAYHLKTTDTLAGQSYMLSGRDHKRVPASEIIHGFDKEWIDQLRGVSWLAQSMLRLRNLHGYEDAAVINARVSAAKMGFFTKGTDGEQYAGNDTDASGNVIASAEPGAFEELPAGMKFEPWAPEFPTAMHADFVKTTLRGISSGLGVSYNLLANDLEGVNYSSIRAGLLDEREQWKLRQQWFIEIFLLPVFRVWLNESLLRGDINLPASKFDQFNKPVFIGRRWAWVDPSNDIEAKTKEVAAGMTTLTQVAAEGGWDFEELMRERADEIAIAEKYGVPLSEGLGEDQQDGENDREPDAPPQVTVHSAPVHVTTPPVTVNTAPVKVENIQPEPKRPGKRQLKIIRNEHGVIQSAEIIETPMEGTA